MKNTFGQSITATIFGESHGNMIGAVLDGVAPGIKVDEDYIRHCLDLRRPFGKISTSRQEPDPFNIVSGVYNGYTTGTPITVIIPNTDTRSRDYSNLLTTPRPSHADYTAQIKYHGFQDPRGGGHFSGRITAGLVAIGAILRSALIDKGIYISTHISSIKGIKDRAISTDEDIKLLQNKLFPVLDSKAESEMISEIEKAAAMGDSVGGVLETAITGLPAGIGEPFFDSMESILSHILFSIPGIKGVEFGGGFDAVSQYGSQFNDSFAIDNGKIVTLTNNNGGINGGITNGMPVIFRCAVKPTPSISKEQMTCDISNMTEKCIKISGRHDPAIIHRARAVVDCASAIAIADMLTVRYGTDFLSK